MTPLPAVDAEHARTVNDLLNTAFDAAADLGRMDAGRPEPAPEDWTDPDPAPATRLAQALHELYRLLPAREVRAIASDVHTHRRNVAEVARMRNDGEFESCLPTEEERAEWARIRARQAAGL